MSANTMLVMDVSVGDLTESTNGPAHDVGQHYQRCMAERFGIELKPADVVVDVIDELGIVELLGPWESVCYVGASTLTIGTGIKWDVFFNYLEDRTEALREALCLAASVGATRLIGLDSGLEANELAVGGAPVEEILASIRRSSRGIELPIAAAKSVDALAERLGEFTGMLETSGYFMVELKSRFL